MKKTSITIVMDKKILNEFNILCDEHGTNVNSAISNYIKKIIKENKRYEKKKIDGNKLFKEIRKNALKSKRKEWTMKEIDEEIRKARSERQ